MPKAPAKKAPAKKAGKKGGGAKAPSKEQPPAVREVLYPEVDARLKTGDDALTVSEAKELLGWTETTGDKYQFTDTNGKKIICHNNLHNREFRHSNAMALASEVLHRRWKLNGESMIVGKTGETIDIQHRAAALVFAGQEWEKDKTKWAEYWKEEPTMECIIVYGIEEDDSTVNTINTGVTRSLSDVLFRSEHLASIETRDRSKVARICAYAIKTLAQRTGAMVDTFVPGRMTHSDCLDFLSRHERLLECVKSIWEEDRKEEGQTEAKLSRWLSPGWLAAFLYLMQTSASDPKAYREAEHPSEDLLDFSLEDRAWDFIIALATKSDELKPVFNAIAVLKESSEGGATGAERAALIAKAWVQYAQQKPVTPKSVELEYSESEDDDGTKYRTLNECPTVGGVDLGNPEDKSDTVDDPTPEEIEQRKAEIDAEKKNGKPPAKKAPVKTPAKAQAVKFDIAIGTKVHVADPSADDEWDGYLMETYVGANKIVVARVKDGEGNVFEVPATALTAL